MQRILSIVCSISIVKNRCGFLFYRRHICGYTRTVHAFVPLHFLFIIHLYFYLHLMCVLFIHIERGLFVRLICSVRTSSDGDGKVCSCRSFFIRGGFFDTYDNNNKRKHMHFPRPAYTTLPIKQMHGMGVQTHLYMNATKP